MSLHTFFAINLPYGIERNEQGEWVAFNREYSPLGYTKKSDLTVEDTVAQSGAPMYCKYRGLTESKLLKLAARDGKSIERDDKGKIRRIWLYEDGSNPITAPSDLKFHFKRYWEKLEILSKLHIAKL